MSSSSKYSKKIKLVTDALFSSPERCPSSPDPFAVPYNTEDENSEIGGGGRSTPSSVVYSERSGPSYEDIKSDTEMFNDVDSSFYDELRSISPVNESEMSYDADAPFCPPRASTRNSPWSPTPSAANSSATSGQIEREMVHLLFIINEVPSYYVQYEKSNPKKFTQKKLKYSNPLHAPPQSLIIFQS